MTHTLQAAITALQLLESRDGACGATRAIRLALREADERERGAGAAWVSVEERLPEEGVRVLAYSPDPERPGVFEAFHMPDFALTHRWQYRNGLYAHEDAVTHWMALPAPPTTSEGE